MTKCSVRPTTRHAQGGGPRRTATESTVWHQPTTMVLRRLQDCRKPECSKFTLTHPYDAHNMMSIIFNFRIMDQDQKPSRKEASHERILDAAAQAVRRGGYSGASVAEVMKEAGLTHGGFYAHFASREQMVAEAISHAGKQSAASLAQSMERLQERGESPFRSLIHTYLSSKHMAVPESGCVVAALGSEMARQPDQVRQASCERVQRLVQLVKSVLPQGVPESEAGMIASTMIGVLQLARALGETEGKAFLETNRKALIQRYEGASVS
jgi:TetR/AcrR family transcriptional regulator, transcriptional repressor for nem operon